MLPEGRVPSVTLESEDGGGGRPTSMPVPGRPLLNVGRLLVYPVGYERPKCECFSFFE